jgi:hypothetical protein
VQGVLEVPERILTQSLLEHGLGFGRKHSEQQFLLLGFVVRGLPIRFFHAAVFSF